MAFAATVDQIQAALDTTRKGATIARGPIPSTNGTQSDYYVFGGVGVKTPAGNGVWVRTNDADNAATQAAAIIAALNA